VEFEKALSGADYVTIHVPVCCAKGEDDKPTVPPDQRGEETLKLMKGRRRTW